MSITTTDPWAALGDRTRRDVLGRVAAGPTSVTGIARGMPISRPAVSQHLRVLREAGLVTVEPRGRERVYALRPEGLQELRADLNRFWRSALDNFKRAAEESGVADDPARNREDSP